MTYVVFTRSFMYLATLCEDQNMSFRTQSNFEICFSHVNCGRRKNQGCLSTQKNAYYPKKNLPTSCTYNVRTYDEVRIDEKFPHHQALIVNFNMMHSRRRWKYDTEKVSRQQFDDANCHTHSPPPLPLVSRLAYDEGPWGKFNIHKNESGR